MNGSAWSSSNIIPIGQVVTCLVSGTPTQAGIVTALGTGGVSTATREINIAGIPDMSISLANLPVIGIIGQAYSGGIICKNIGSADALTGTSCTVTGLPSELTLNSCTIGTAGTAWSPGSIVPKGETVICTVTGTPKKSADLVLNGATSANGGSSSAHNTATQKLTIKNAPAALPVPTLSHWAQVLIAGLLVALGLLTLRNRRL